MSDTCRLVPPFGDPWPSCLLPSYHEHLDVQAGFRKGRGTRDQIANIHRTIKKARNIYFGLIAMPKPLTVCITTNCGKIWKRWTTWEICMQVKKQQLELDIEQQTGSKLGKEYIKAVFCQPAYLTYTQSTSCKMPDWMTHKLESRLPGGISITSDMQMTAPLWQKVKKNLRLLMKVKEESEKVGLKLNIENSKIMISHPITSW